MWAQLHNVGWTHNAQSAAIENVRVNLSCANVGMPEKFLHRADIVAALEKLRSETVPECVVVPCFVIPAACTASLIAF